jgi:LysM repeat protein
VQEVSEKPLSRQLASLSEPRETSPPSKAGTTPKTGEQSLTKQKAKTVQKAKQARAKTSARSKRAKEKPLQAHSVRRGDTLGEIARRYGISVHALMQANDLRTSRIEAGAALCIPHGRGARL